MRDDDNPTDAERFAIEQAWNAGEELPPGWVVVELPAGMVANGWVVPPRTFVILRHSRVAQAHAGQLGDND